MKSVIKTSLLAALVLAPVYVIAHGSHHHHPSVETDISQHTLEELFLNAKHNQSDVTMAALNKSLIAYPQKDAMWHLAKGYALQYQHEFAIAQAHFNKAMLLDSKLVTAKLMLAETHLQLKQFLKAKSLCVQIALEVSELVGHSCATFAVHHQSPDLGHIAHLESLIARNLNAPAQARMYAKEVFSEIALHHNLPSKVIAQLSGESGLSHHGEHLLSTAMQLTQSAQVTD